MIELENESLARAQLPYRAEYCKTSRANCKKCCRIMQADDLKLANMTKSRFHDGYDSNFYHVKCFFQVKRPTSVAEIRHFETLKYEDQKMLEEAVRSQGLSILGKTDGDTKENNTSSRRSTKRSKIEPENESNSTSGDVLCNYDDFLIEYAKSNRATCNLCEVNIPKNEVRLGKLDYEADTAWRGGPVPRWFHVECFAKALEQLEFYGKVGKIKGFADLEDEDKKFVSRHVKQLKGKTLVKSEPKKIKPDLDAEHKENVKSKDDLKEEKLLKNQSDKFFELREEVNEIKKKDLELLLSHMNQKFNFKNPSQLVDAATDVLMFGPLDKCPECKQTGGMVLRGGGYICTLTANEWEPCTYETRKPKRSKVDIPEEFLDRNPYFAEDYKFKGGDRLFSSAYYKALEKKEAELNNTVQDGAPLDGLSIGVINWKGVEMDREKVKKKIIMLGGTIQTSLDKTLFVIISSKKQLADEADMKVEVAKELNIPFVKPDFLFEIESKSDVVLQLKKFLLAPKWSGDLEARFTGMNVNQLKQKIKSRSASSIAKSIYKSGSVAKSQTLVVKDGTAVDPDSGYVDVCRVYKQNKNIYSVVLNSVDVARDKNSYYKLQIIQHEEKKLYICFRSWGRIGSGGVGGNTCASWKNPTDAIAMFEKIFEEKTGNPFSSLVDKTFKRVQGLYFPIELDYGDVNKAKEIDNDLKYSDKSILAKQVQDLICFIFDIQRMNKIMKEFELDAEKMPLGKLSQKQILEAMQVLKELEKTLNVKPPKRPTSTKLIGLTNKFYSLIPQSFGDGQVELIKTLEQIEEKNKMLEGLSEIQVAYDMCSSIDKSSDDLPVDQYYMQLKCSMTHLESNHTDYKIISDYVKLTHAITHNNYKLDIQNIFSISRADDLKRFKEHRDKHRALLWHGSRTTNYAGIIKEGLRIAPKEAPTTGFMFGKGIYFADMASKAANYCMTDPTNNTGLLLLCEVALGNMHLLHESEADLPKKLPKDCHSVKGVGKNCTNPKTHVKIEDDLLVPVGTQKAVRVKSQLLYNEYVVYQESQAMIRYIVEVKFDYKS